MNQQINLYQPLFRAERKVFTTRTLLQASAVVLVALVGMYVYVDWQAERMDVERARLAAQVQSERARLAQLSRQQAAQPVAEREAQVAALTAQRNVKLDVLQRLDSRALGNTDGFSSFMTALARQHTAELWITGFAIEAGGERFTLRGAATEPASVPRYLQRLAAESAFSGRRFQQLNIERSQEQTRRVEFAVSTERGEGEGAP